MGIQINGNTNNINAGIGSLSIEDLKEIDIVGVATASNFKTGISNLHDVGLTLTGGQIDVGSNIKIGNAGVITATSFVGSGADLTGIAADKIFEGNTEAEVVDTGSDGHFKVTTEGNERFRIDSSGNVTIIYAKQLLFENDAQNASSAILNLGASGTSNLIFATGGSEKVRIDSNGKIIQTAATNTTATLDLYGGNTTVSATGEVNAQLRFRSKDNSVTNSEENVGGAIKSITEFSNGAYVGMAFETYKQDRTPRLKEALRITHAGNIGINDIGPANFTGYTNLSIHGSTGGAITFGDDGVDEWEIYGGDGTIKIYDRANTQERIRIVDNGAIGLGGANYGTAGQVLTSQGSGSPVQWASVSAYGGALDGMIFGGSETTYTSGGTTYKVHTFLSTGFLRVTAATSMDFLIVGGGGGSPQAEGSWGSSGGGGAGGMVEGTGITIPVGKHTITVGQGGAASDKYTVGGTGGDSSFAYGGGTVTAKGGGGGADYGSHAGVGGCGGGGAEPNTPAGASNQSSQNSGISGISQFGNAGGQGGSYQGSGDGSGGGGGAGGAGAARSSGGAGGSGRANSITGSSVTYAVGGAGGSSGYHHGTAGTNGRGNGASGASASHPNEGLGAAGGSGIVIVRYVFT